MRQYSAIARREGPTSGGLMSRPCMTADVFGGARFTRSWWRVECQSLLETVTVAGVSIRTAELCDHDEVPAARRRSCCRTRAIATSSLPVPTR